MTDEPVRDVIGALGGAARASSARRRRGWRRRRQVHGDAIVVHHAGLGGLAARRRRRRPPRAERGTALAVTVADCVPVFIAHPSGAIALLHSGWRGTAARIVERGDRGAGAARLPARRAARAPRPGDLRQCYEVSADVYAQLTGTRSSGGRRRSICARSSPTMRARAACAHITSARRARAATTIASSRIAPATRGASSAVDRGAIAR